MSVEVAFLSKLIETGDWGTVDELQIKQKYFYGKNRRMFKWVQDFKTQYGKVPSLPEFKKKFRDFEPIEAPEVMRFYCDEVRNKMKHNTIVDGFEEAQEHLNEFDTEEAYTILKKIVYQIENEIVKSEVRKINEDTSRRWEQYLERKNFGGISGIPTNIIPLDMMLGGIKETDLITILGFTGTGKFL